MSVIYGVNYTVAKGVMPQFLEPLGFIFIRAAGAAILFWFLHLAGIREKVSPKDFGLMAICGLFGVAMNQMLFFSGLNLTSPINASIMLTINPILVLIAASIILKERLSWRKITGITIGLFGAWVVVTYGKSVQFGSNTLLGDLLVFGNAASYTVYLVLVKPLMKKYHPVTVMKWVFLFGFIYVIPFGTSQFIQIKWQSFTPAVWGSVAFVVVATTFLAYLLNVYAMKKVSPTVVSVYIYNQPVVASITAVAIGMDTLNVAKVVAAALIFFGVYLISFSK